MKTKQLILATVLSLMVQAWGTTKAMADIRTPDEQLRALGEQKLTHAKLVDKVDLTVDNAAATLSGTVDSIGVKERAGQEISKVPGIKSVTNNLQVADAPGGDDQVLGKIAHEVRLYPYYTIFDNIEASANAGRVKITGQVMEPWRKTDIGRLVSMVQGVKEIENDLEVLPLSPSDNAIRQRIARAIYGNPLFIRYANEALPPIHIIVKNGNVTLVGYVHDEVEKATAFSAARFAATYFDLNNQLVVETKLAKTK